MLLCICGNCKQFFDKFVFGYLIQYIGVVFVAQCVAPKWLKTAVKFTVAINFILYDMLSEGYFTDEWCSTDKAAVTSYLIILGEEFGEFLMPPLRCFFLGDSADCWSSSTATKGSGMRVGIIGRHAKIHTPANTQNKNDSVQFEVSEFKEIERSVRDRVESETGWTRWSGQDIFTCVRRKTVQWLHDYDIRQDTLAHHLHGCVWGCKHAIVPSSTIMPNASLIR